MVDTMCDYYAGIDQQRVRPDVQPGFLQGRLPASAPEQPESFDAVMQSVQQDLLPGW
jgi:histidine decarboxylase